MGTLDDRAKAHPTTQEISTSQSGRSGSDDVHELGTKERHLLRILIGKQGRVVPRSELARAVGLRANERRVDVYLVMIRRVLGDSGLINVRGRGWMVPSDVDESEWIGKLDAVDGIKGPDTGSRKTSVGIQKASRSEIQ
jgi:DNA-binding winged helix-turn-helix (wHTH) protein